MPLGLGLVMGYPGSDSGLLPLATLALAELPQDRLEAQDSVSARLALVGCQQRAASQVLAQPTPPALWLLGFLVAKRLLWAALVPERPALLLVEHPPLLP
jgi:hypothetical protein